MNARGAGPKNAPHEIEKTDNFNQLPLAPFVDLRCGRRTTKCFGRIATLRQPGQGFAFNPPLRFLLRDETGDVVVLAVGPCNSDVPSTR